MTMLLTALGPGLVSILAATSMAPAQADTTGTVTTVSKSVAVGVGVSWGDGTLEYRGEKYPFSVSGLRVVVLGVSKVTAEGKVETLDKLEDFNGEYTMAGAGPPWR